MMMNDNELIDPTAEPGVLPPAFDQELPEAAPVAQVNPLMRGQAGVPGAPATVVPGPAPTRFTPATAYDALRSRGAAGYDGMGSIEATQYGTAYNESMLADNRTRIAQAEMAARQAAARGAGGGAGGVGPTGIAATSPQQLIINKLTQKYGLVYDGTPESQDKFAKYVQLLGDEDKTDLLNQARSSSALSYNFGKDNPAGAAAWADQSAAEMQTLLSKYGLGPVDERGAFRKGVDTLMSAGASGIAGTFDLAEGLDSLTGGTLAGTEFGKRVFEVGENIRKEGTSAQAAESQRRMARAMELDRPMGEILDILTDNPDYLGSLGGSALSFLGPQVVARLSTAIAARAAGAVATRAAGKRLGETAVKLETRSVEKAEAALAEAKAAAKQFDELADLPLFNAARPEMAARAAAAQAKVATRQAALASAKEAAKLGTKGLKGNALKGATKAGTNKADMVRKAMSGGFVNVQNAALMGTAVAQYGASQNDIRDGIKLIPLDKLVPEGSDNRREFEADMTQLMTDGATPEVAAKEAEANLRARLTEAAQSESSNANAASAALTALPLAAAIPGLKGLAGFGALERLASGQGGSFSGNVLKRAAKGAAFESTQETLQSGAEQYGANLGALSNPQIAAAQGVTDPLDSVVKTAAVGGVVGGMLGGPFGAIGGDPNAVPAAPKTAGAKIFPDNKPNDDDPPIGGTQGNKPPPPPPPAGAADIPPDDGGGGAGASVEAEANGATVSTDTPEQAQARSQTTQKSFDATSGAVDTLDLTEESGGKKFFNQFKGMFGFRDGTSRSKPLAPAKKGAKSNAAALYTFSPLWATHTDDAEADDKLLKRNELFAPFIADGKLTDPELLGMLGEIQASQVAFEEAVKKGNKLTPEAREKASAAQSATMADIDARVSSKLMGATPQENSNVVQANPETQESGVLDTNQPEASGPNPQPQTGRVQRVWDSASQADVFTAKKINPNDLPDVVPLGTPEAAQDFGNAIGATENRLTIAMSKNKLAPVIRLATQYNAAMAAGVPRAQIAKVMQDMRNAFAKKALKPMVMESASETLVHLTVAAKQAAEAMEAAGAGNLPGKPKASMTTDSTSSTSTMTSPATQPQTPVTADRALERGPSAVLSTLPEARVREVQFLLQSLNASKNEVAVVVQSLGQLYAATREVRAALALRGIREAAINDAIASVIKSYKDGDLARAAAVFQQVDNTNGFSVYFANASPFNTTRGAIQVILHEVAGHGGLVGLTGGSRTARNDILDIAASNKTVRALAHALAPTWELNVKTREGWLSAVEEALAELAGAGFDPEGIRTLSKRYNVQLDSSTSNAESDGGLGAVLQRVIERLRTYFDDLTNSMTTDAEVRDILASMAGYMTSGQTDRRDIARAFKSAHIQLGFTSPRNQVGYTPRTMSVAGPEVRSPIAAGPGDPAPDPRFALQGQRALDVVLPREEVMRQKRSVQRKPWTKGSKFVTWVFNSAWGLKREIEHIVANGGTMNDAFDFYTNNILGKGISAQTTAEDSQNVINPSIDAISGVYKRLRLRKANGELMTGEEFFEAISGYVMAKHAKERNTTFYYEKVELEDPGSYQARLELFSEMRMRGIEPAEYMRRLRTIVLQGKPKEAYSDNGTTYSGLTNAEADARLAKLSEAGITEEVGMEINTLLDPMRKTREQRALEGGLFGDAGVNVQRTRNWQFYVPLRGMGFDRDIEDRLGDDPETPTLIGGRGSYGIYGAEGRATEADNGIEALRNEVLMYGGRVGTRFFHSSLLGAANANSELMGVAIAILHYDAKSGMYIHEASGQYVKDLQAFTKGSAGESMIVAHSAGARYNGRNNDTKYVIKFPNQGKESLVLGAINADRHTAMKAPIAELGIAKYTGFMARAQTSLNPFWMFMTSWVRDITGYPTMLVARLGMEKGSKVASKYLANLSSEHLAGPMAVIFDGPNHRSLADIRRMAQEEGSWAYYYQKLLDLGGANAYDAQFEGVEDTLGIMTDPQTGVVNGVKGAFGKYEKMASTWADALEASHRVAIFKALLDSGFSDKAAAGLTKDLLNFQQVGVYGRDINAFIQFFKTSATSIDSMVRSFRTEKGEWDVKKAAAFGSVLAMGGAILTAFSAAMMGDDDEGEPYADRVRADDWAKGMVVPTGDGSYRRVDVGLGFGGLSFGLGALATRFAQGKMEPGEYSAAVFNVINRNATPIQSAGVSKDATADEYAAAIVYGWAVPSLARPVIDVAANRNNFGGNIYQNPAFTQGKADAFSGRPSTPDFFKGITESVFGSTNGAIDVHPETLEYFFSSYLGSPARAAMNFVDSAHAEATGGETRKSLLDPFFLPGADTTKSWETDRMYNMLSDLDLAKARTEGGVASPADAAAAEFSSRMNSIKTNHSKAMKDIRSNQLLSPGEKRRRIEIEEADLNRQMILVEEHVKQAKKAAR